MGPCRSHDTGTCSLLILLLLLPAVSAEKIVSCDNVTIANGAVFRTTNKALSDTMLVQCHPGYYLVPSEGSILRCENGSVRHALPQCVQKVIDMKNCSYTCNIQNGNCEPSNQEFFRPGETVRTVCKAGYSLSSKVDKRTCRVNGTWDRQMQPSCASSCKVTESEIVEFFLDPHPADGDILVAHSAQLSVKCKKGYIKEENVKITCQDGHFDKDISSLCKFNGVDLQISYTYTDVGGTFTNTSKGELITFEKGENITFTCKVSSKTEDGKPYPEVTWLYPSRLRDFVEYRDGDTFVHSDYRKSVQQTYSISVVDEKHYAQGILTISPTMEVHSGEYTCVVKLVNFTDYSTATIKIKPDFVIAMYFLLIIPVVLFVIVHCFYRKATLSPFPAPNKLTKDMMQEENKEVDKKKKLEELQANPAYQHIQVMGEKNHRGRRGAVVDI